MTYIDDLIENCKLAKKAQPVREFILTKPEDLDGIDRAVYVIEEIDGDPTETFVAFSQFKQTKSRACARRNAPSNVLYVGSSTTGLKKRISEHAGDGSASTYALHLSHWFKGKYRVTIKVYDEPLAVLQIIEDALAHELRPAFGKTGANGK